MKTPAHAILDAARDGADIAPEVIEEALIATGDLPGIRQRHARYVEASRRIEADGREINRLRAQITALEECVRARDALQDSAYIAGLNAGFGLGYVRNAAELQRLIEARNGYLHAIREPVANPDRLPPQG